MFGAPLIVPAVGPGTMATPVSILLLLAGSYRLSLPNRLPTRQPQGSPRCATFIGSWHPPCQAQSAPTPSITPKMSQEQT